jgi:hypothetical protein
VRDWAHEPEIAAVMSQAGAAAVLDQLDLDHSWRELESEHHSGKAAPAVTRIDVSQKRGEAAESGG